MAQANILIVDDTPQNSAFLSRVLEKFYQVRSFNSGKSALKAAQSGWADIILLDTKMPDANGYEVCRLLRAGVKTHDLGIIFLGTFDNILKTKAFKVGGNDYITKPFKIEEVMAKVGQQVKLIQASREIAVLKQGFTEKIQQLEIEKDELTSEIAQREQAQNQLLQLALYDSTTGLPNRNSFLGKIKELLNRYQQQKEYQFAVFLIQFELSDGNKSGLNLGKFSAYLEREENDKLIKEISNRIKSCLASSSLLSRFENDQFAIITDKLTEGNEEIKRWLEAIEQKFQEPFSVTLNQKNNQKSPQPIQLKLKAGIVANSDRYSAAYEILRDAELALYQAQEPIGANYYIFDEPQTYEQKEAIISKKATANPLEIKLKTHFLESFTRGNVQFSYQPVFKLENESFQNVEEGEDIIFEGIEIFDDQRQAYRKLLLLTDFFPKLEKSINSNLGLHVTKFTLELAASYIKGLQQQHSKQQNLFVALECDHNFISQPDLIKSIEEILLISNLEPQHLHLDLVLKPENFSRQQTLITIQQLSALGIKLSLVCKYLTYGTLKNLVGLPFSSFKLTSNLINLIISADTVTTLPPKNTEDPKYSKQYVAKSEIARIINLAQKNNILVAAKTVNTKEQLNYLSSVGCNYAQGDFLSKPLSRESLETFLIWRV